MKKIFLILICSCALSVYAQEWTIEYSIGYGTYQMDDIKKLQSFAAEEMEWLLGAKITDRFPGYITHNAAAGFLTQKHHFGANFSYLTTGGRIHVADYSGSYSTDMILNGYKVGAFYRYHISTGFEPLKFFAQLSPGAIFSNLKIEEKLKIYDISESEKEKMKATGYFIEPSLGVKYQISRMFSFSIRGGYEFDLGGKLKYLGEKSNAKIEWNGLRVNAGIMLSLPYIE